MTKILKTAALFSLLTLAMGCASYGKKCEKKCDMKKKEKCSKQCDMKKDKKKKCCKKKEPKA